MSRLAAVRKGAINTSLRCLFYGAEGVGKSTLAASAPSPILFDIEGGADQLDVPRYMFGDGPQGHVPTSMDEVYEAIKDLSESEHAYQTLIIDTITGLEPLIWSKVCQQYSGAKGAVNKTGKKLQSIDEIDFQAGYKVADEAFRFFLNALDGLRLAKGMSIILVGHSVVRPFKNPIGDDYDRIEPSVHKLAAASIKRWADIIGYCAFEEGVGKESERARPKGFDTGRRLINFKRSAAWDAKTRVPLPDVVEMALEDAWQPFAQAVAKGRNLTPEKLLEDIREELVRINDLDLTNKVVMACKEHTDAPTLSRYLNDLKQRPALQEEA